MDVHVVGNGKLKVKIQCVEQRREFYQRFFAFVSPYFLPQKDEGEIDLYLNLKEDTAFSWEWKKQCRLEHQIRHSSAEAFNLILMRGELADGTHVAWNERDTTGYAFTQGTQQMDMYVSNNSFIHLIEFFRYYLLLLEVSRGSMLLHASAVENTVSGKIVAICGAKGAGKTSTMLNLLESSRFRYFSGDKLLVDMHDNALRVRGWPDYPHVGVGSLRQHPKLCHRIGLVTSEPPMSVANDSDKYLFTPELFYSALGKPFVQEGPLEAVLLSDIMGEKLDPVCLKHKEKLDLDESKLFEDPYQFLTATWHGLHRPEISEPVGAEHEQVRHQLYASNWLALSGNVPISTIEQSLKQTDQIKLALVASSGAGKSTTAELLKKSFNGQGLTVSIEKLAKPLYGLQAAYFHVLAKEQHPEIQHQQLLEQIATNLRMLNPHSLVDNLFARLDYNTDKVVITDDLRDLRTDWPALVAKGYVIVKVICDEQIRQERLEKRQDLQSQVKSHLDSDINAIEADLYIENSGDLTTLERNVEAFVRSLLGSQYGREIA